MKYLRWYDKDPLLKSFIATLESLDEQTIDLLAQDFIQVIMDSGYINVDETIGLLAKTAPKSYNRWYDKNYNLHSCIEFIRTLPEERREELINKFKESCFNLITAIYYEKE